MITIEWATAEKSFSRTYSNDQEGLARMLNSDLSANEDLIWISTNFPGKGRETWKRNADGIWDYRRI